MDTPKKIFFDLYAELRSALVLSVTYFDDAQLRSTLAHACTTLYAVYKPNLDNKQYLITALAVLSVPAITRLTLTPTIFFLFFFSLNLSGNGTVVHLTGLRSDSSLSAVRHVSSVSGYGYSNAEVRLDEFCVAVRGSEAVKNNILDGQMT